MDRLRCAEEQRNFFQTLIDQYSLGDLHEDNVSSLHHVREVSKVSGSIVQVDDVHKWIFLLQNCVCVEALTELSCVERSVEFSGLLVDIERVGDDDEILCEVSRVKGLREAASSSSGVACVVEFTGDNAGVAWGFGSLIDEEKGEESWRFRCNFRRKGGSLRARFRLPDGDTQVQLTLMTGCLTYARQYAAAGCLPECVEGMFSSEQKVPAKCPVDDSSLRTSTQESKSSGLNRYQEQFVGAVLAMLREQREHPSLVCLWGPPGTGKTFTLTDMMLRASSSRALVCAPSNKAVSVLARALVRRSTAGPTSELDQLRVCWVGNEHEVGDAAAAYGTVRPHLCAHDMAARLDGMVQLTCADRLQQAYGAFLRLCRRWRFVPFCVHEDLWCAECLAGETRTLELWAKRVRALERNHEQKASKMITQFASRVTQVKEALVDVAGGEEGGFLLSPQHPVYSHLVKNAQCVLCTMSVAGRPSMLKLLPSMNLIVMDEVSQAAVPESLIPLQYVRADTVVVVAGDTKQLPPVIKADVLRRHLQYDRSLLEMASHTFMLRVQYRMHPLIRDFPSRAFYGGRLIDGPGVGDNEWTGPSLPRYQCIDVGAGRECMSVPRWVSEYTEKHKLQLPSLDEAPFSFCNWEEAFSIAQCLEQMGKRKTRPQSVGVIAFYKAQTLAIRWVLDSALSSQHDKDSQVRRFLRDCVVVSTVDAFQGSECDMILLSCVRANDKPFLRDSGSEHMHPSLGFLSDERRLNVAITRAKHVLAVFGHRNTLVRGGPCQQCGAGYVYQLWDDYEKRMQRRDGAR